MRGQLLSTIYVWGVLCCQERGPWWRGLLACKPCLERTCPPIFLSMYFGPASPDSAQGKWAYASFLLPHTQVVVQCAVVQRCAEGLQKHVPFCIWSQPQSPQCQEEPALYQIRPIICLLKRLSIACCPGLNQEPCPTVKHNTMGLTSPLLFLVVVLQGLLAFNHWVRRVECGCVPKSTTCWPSFMTQDLSSLPGKLPRAAEGSEAGPGTVRVLQGT